MSTHLLATKLAIPPLRPTRVSRSRLIERLNRGLRHGKLTLVSAPAGFGKTTLISSWLAKCERPALWLSLDEGDNDLTRFLTYVVSALQPLEPTIGLTMLGLLQSLQPPPLETLLTTLVNDLAALPHPFLLVLDDYHVIDSQPIDQALTFLLEHLPPPMHLVMATREDPPLPLARYRARGQLTELRAADLRFTRDEVADFLNHVMGLTLSSEAVANLESRTEGWVVGLQLAALSMQGQPNIPAFIETFRGSHRFVLDYLVEEVLHQQPEPVQSFLLQTAILERLSGPLCEALTQQTDGQTMLERLERANLFVIPLDEERRWYRYHHLFAQVLQARLMEAQPHQVVLLHERATGWYEQHDFPTQAIQHALMGQHFERAAQLIERTWFAMRRTRQEATLLSWMKALPPALVQSTAALSVAYAWALLDDGKLEAAENSLQMAEQRLAAKDDDPSTQSLAASIANARAYHAQAIGDWHGTVRYTQQALKLLPADDHYERGTAASLLGLAQWASGELEAAHRSFADGLAHLQLAGGLLIRIGGTAILAAIRRMQGRLGEAIKEYERALQLVEAQNEATLQGTAELYLGLSELHLERGDWATATQHFQRGQALRQQASLPGFDDRWPLVQAALHEAQGDWEAALPLLHEAERLHARSPLPDVQPISALKARLWLRQGRLVEAENWERQQKLSADDDLSYLHEYEHLTLARLWLARSQPETAMRLLPRLLEAAERQNREGSLIDILLVLALAHHASGDIEAALVSIERALSLAEPEGYVRIFVDEGPPLARLLHEATKRNIRPNYVGQLLTALEAQPGRWRRNTKSSHPPSPPSPLIDPLSPREREVLRLFQTELSGPEIAHDLMIALSTVRTHTKNIYSKLNVNSRRAAVKRAIELGLI